MADAASEAGEFSREHGLLLPNIFSQGALFDQTVSFIFIHGKRALTCSHMHRICNICKQNQTAAGLGKWEAE